MTSRNDFWRAKLLLLHGALAAAGCSDPAGNGSSASSRTWWVDQTNHSGISDGNQNSPLLRIQDAIDRSAGGDIVRVAAGVYDERLEVPHTLQLIGAGADQTAIDASGSGHVLAVDGGVRDVLVQGFTLTGGFGDGGAVCELSDVGVTFRECYVTENTLDPGSTVESRGILRLSDAGAYRVERCILFDNDGSGIAGRRPGSLVVENTVVGMTTRHGVHIAGDPDTQAPDLVLRNVSVWGVPEDGVRLGEFVDANFQNLLVADSGIGIRESSTSGDPHLAYVSLPNGYFDRDLQTRITDAAQIQALTPPGDNVGIQVADPSFVDPAAGDFTLAAGSPAIDAGDPSILDANGSRSDMGAFGGPGGDFDLSPPAVLSDAGGSFSSPRPLVEYLDAGPAAVAGGDPWTLDFDLDGELETLQVTADGTLVRRTAATPSRPLRNPRLEEPVHRVTAFDLDDDGRREWIFETGEADRRRFHVQPVHELPTLPPIAVRTRRGDLVTARIGDCSCEPRTVDFRGDRADGAVWLAAPAESFDVSVMRDGREWVLLRNVHPGEFLDLLPHEADPSNSPLPTGTPSR